MRRRRLTRAGPLAWLLGLYWVGMAMLAVALIADERPALSAVIGALGVALVIRMAVMGVYGDDREFRCVSWLVTRHVPLAEVADVRVVGYSGFGNRFSESRMLSMLVVERYSGGPIVLRGEFARAMMAKRAARTIQDHLERSRPAAA